MRFYNYDVRFLEFQKVYNDWGAWAVFFAGVTPFPYKVITILSGATQLDFFIFSIASLFARGLRFFSISALLYFFGERIREFIEERLGLVFGLFVVLLFGGFLVTRYLG